MKPTRLLLPAFLLAALCVASLAVAQDAEQQPFLGIQLEPDATPPTIAEVVDGGSAKKMGLQAGDVILAFNGTPTPNVQALVGKIRASKVGDEITVRVKRGDEEIELTGTLGTRPPRPTVVGQPAPPLKCQKWGNLPDGAEPPTIESLKGKVVLIHCFQGW